MKTVFVTKKSEITAFLGTQLVTHSQPPVKIETYRTRLNCNCRYPFNFRYGALIVKDNEVVEKVIRCKQCAKTSPLCQQEADISPLQGENKKGGGL